MQDFLTEWLIVAGLTLMAAASPGPDFVIIVRNSVVHSRKSGVLTSLGIALGVAVHMTYCILGIAALIAQSVVLFSAIKWVGALYLIYIGIKSLRSGGYKETLESPVEGNKAFSSWAAFRSGFLTNLLNPKATMFFLALFTQVIDPHTPVQVQIFYGLTVILTGGAWWLFVALVLTDSRFKNFFLRFSKWIDRLTGGLLVALGLKLAASRI